MNYDTLVTYIEQYGYFALFLALWLGIVGMPIPDEVVVLTGGAVTSGGMLLPYPAFLLTYLGVVSGLSIGYALGRFFGKSVLERLKRKRNMNRYIDMAEKLVSKYGSFAICISYFFPIIRHVMPYVVGLNKMSFKRYALFSFTTGFVWTLIFFTVGHFVGDHAGEVGDMIYRIGLKWLWLPCVLAAVYFIIHYSARHPHSNRRDRA